MNGRVNGRPRLVLPTAGTVAEGVSSDETTGTTVGGGAAAGAAALALRGGGGRRPRGVAGGRAGARLRARRRARACWQLQPALGAQVGADCNHIISGQESSVEQRRGGLVEQAFSDAWYWGREGLHAVRERRSSFGPCKGSSLFWSQIAPSTNWRPVAVQRVPTSTRRRA